MNTLAEVSSTCTYLDVQLELYGKRLGFGEECPFEHSLETGVGLRLAQLTHINQVVGLPAIKSVNELLQHNLRTSLVDLKRTV